jgi:hypothetical protein
MLEARDEVFFMRKEQWKKQLDFCMVVSRTPEARKTFYLVASA